MQQTNELCLNQLLNSYSACTTSLKILQNLLPTIVEQDLSFKELVGHQRSKRGLFDAVGKVFKVLIGTLDADDAENYNNAINELSNGERDLTSLLKTQSSVVQSTITNFNNTVTSIHNAEKVFNKNIILLQNLTQSTNITLRTQSLKQNIEDHITLLLLISTELNREYSNLINSVLFMKQNILHPSILTPSRIINELSKTKRYLPMNTNYPFSLNKAYVHEILKLVTLSAYYMDSKLIFLVYIPIIDNESYTLYHLLPLPILSKNNTHIFIKPSSDYMTITLNKMSYSPLATLTDCKQSIEFTYICQRKEPIYNTLWHGNCETELLLNHVTIPKSCDIRITSIINEIWYQLIEQNKWLYVVPQITHITIDCHKKGLYDIQIKGTGFLTLTPSCKAYTKSVTLIPTVQLSSSISTFIPELNIITDSQQDEHPIPSLQFIPLNNPISNLDDLKTASFKLNQISLMADQINHKTQIKEKIQFYDIFIKCISIVSVIIITYYIVKLVYKCKRKSVIFEYCTKLAIKQSSDSINDTVDIEMENRIHQSLPNLRTPLSPAPSHSRLPITPSAPPHPTPNRRSARLRDKL